MLPQRILPPKAVRWKALCPQNRVGWPQKTSLSSEGDFTYLELEYGTPAQVVLPLFGLSGAEPDREWESNGGGTHSEYRAGAVDLDGASFGLTLGSLDGLLNSFTFTCDAQEGEDLTPLYEDLRAQLGSLYGLPEEESVLEDVLAPAQEERGKDLLYDIQRFSSVVEEEGERATRLSLSLLELDGAGVQLELTLGPVPVSTFPGKTQKSTPLGGAFSLSWAASPIGKAGP